MTLKQIAEKILKLPADVQEREAEIQDTNTGEMVPVTLVIQNVGNGQCAFFFMSEFSGED